MYDERVNGGLIKDGFIILHQKSQNIKMQKPHSSILGVSKKGNRTSECFNAFNNVQK